MKHYLDLIPISAKVHKKQSRMTMICIVLAVFLVTAIFSMADMEMRSQKLQVIKSSGNWHVIFSGIDEQIATMIAARPEVKTSGWYAYENTGYSVSGKPVYVAGVDQSGFDDIFPMTLTEGEYPSKKNELVLSENAKSGLGTRIGETITLEHKGSEPIRLTVVGFFEGTAKLLRNDTYALMLTTEGFRSYGLEEGANSEYVVQLSEFCKMRTVINDIKQQYQLSDQQVMQNGKLLAVIGQSNHSYVLGLYGTAAVLFVLVLLAGVFMIASSLNSNVMQRTEFFGMMRCLGASKKQIMRFVCLEGLHWCKTAIPVGVAIGIVIVWVLCALLKVLSPGYFAEMPTFAVSWIGILSGIAVGIITVLLAARSPAKKAARVSPLAAVSGNANPVQAVRTPANTSLLNIDAALGLHHALSSKKNFLLMVGSFSLSIILFLCFSATIQFMHHAVKPLKPWTPDLSMVSPDNTCSLPSNLPEQLRAHEQVERVYGRMFSYDIPAKANGQDKVINLISYEDHQFAWAKKSLLGGSLDDIRRNDNQVLVVYDSKSSLHLGDTLTLNLGKETKTVTVAALLSSSPFDQVDGVETVICSEAVFRELTGQTNYTIVDIQLFKHATDEDVNDIRSLAGSDLLFSDRRTSNREAIGAFYSMALFIYGFLVVIAFITIFNIVNSVSMSVSARIKQYGAMRAIGMSSHQLVRMVTSEAILYSVAGSITGCLLGLPLHKLIFEEMITAHWGDPWQLPIGALLLIVTIVILTSLLAVRGPARRIHTMSIVDTINAQ